MGQVTSGGSLGATSRFAWRRQPKGPRCASRRRPRAHRSQKGTPLGAADQGLLVSQHVLSFLVDLALLRTRPGTPRLQLFTCFWSESGGRRELSLWRLLKGFWANFVSFEAHLVAPPPGSLP